jgi:hypothetical protein
MAEFVSARLAGDRAEVTRHFDWTSARAASRLATLLDEAIG